MKLLTPLNQLEIMPHNALVTCECYQCALPFTIDARTAKMVLNNVTTKTGKYYAKYCSQRCTGLTKITRVEVTCAHCDAVFNKLPKEIAKSKSGNHFCGKKCAATFNNLNKTHGTRRSKLEVWLESKIAEVYPELEVKYCNKTAIKSELDIYFPSLLLAFELNGIYHYEPIHGQPKLDQVQNNDHRKFQACLERNIELVIVDTSHLKYFKEANCQKYLDILKKIVDSKLN